MGYWKMTQTEQTKGLEKHFEIIEDIHRTVVGALEQNIYRKNIGRFEVSEAQGEFHICEHVNDNRQLTILNGGLKYKLDLDLVKGEVPCLDDFAESISVKYVHIIDDSTRVTKVQTVSVDVHYSENPKDCRSSSLNCEYSINGHKLNTHNTAKTEKLPELLQWINTQLKAEGERETQS